jgi:Cu(I)/Ag(I) efflux system membrane protein CusA/SilA
VVRASDTGTPIRIKDLGTVVLGPDLRRGVSDLDGKGDVVSGIVIMRHGQNALDVIERVKAKIKEIEPGLPPGVKIVPIYDRSDLILRSIDNLKSTVIEVLITVAFVVFLSLHILSALIPVITLPIVILFIFIPFRMLGITANIMSWGNCHCDWGHGGCGHCGGGTGAQEPGGLGPDGPAGGLPVVLIRAVKQVAGPSFFALLVIAVSFLPVLTLEAEEGRLFKPLAYTKTLAMIVAALLAITLDPALRLLLTHAQNFSFRPKWLCRATNAAFVGTIQSEDRHPISRFLIRIYEPVAKWSLRWKWVVIAGAVGLVISTIPVYNRLGSEFMPPLERGLFFMPTTMPGISITEAQKVLQITDRIIKQFPEVEWVLGKAGRAETSTDPAPLSMLETVIILKPKSEWRKAETWYSGWAPEWARSLFRRITPDHISQEKLISEMNEALKIPGLANAWTMPIKGRIDMLSTAAVGLARADLIRSRDWGEIQSPAIRKRDRRFRRADGSGYFLDFEWN